MKRPDMEGEQPSKNVKKHKDALESNLGTKWEAKAHRAVKPTSFGQKTESEWDDRLKEMEAKDKTDYNTKLQGKPIKKPIRKSRPTIGKDADDQNTIPFADILHKIRFTLGGKPASFYIAEDLSKQQPQPQAQSKNTPHELLAEGQAIIAATTKNTTSEPDMLVEQQDNVFEGLHDFSIDLTLPVIDNLENNPNDRQHTITTLYPNSAAFSPPPADEALTSRHTPSIIIPVQPVLPPSFVVPIVTAPAPAPTPTFLLPAFTGNRGLNSTALTCFRPPVHLSTDNPSLLSSFTNTQQRRHNIPMQQDKIQNTPPPTEAPYIAPPAKLPIPQQQKQTSAQPKRNSSIHQRYVATTHMGFTPVAFSHHPVSDDIYYQQTTLSQDVWHSICQKVSSSTILTSIRLHNVTIDTPDGDVAKLDVSRISSKIETLAIKGSNIALTGCSTFLNLQNLKHIILNEHIDEQTELSHITTALQYQTSLTVLDIAKAPIYGPAHWQLCNYITSSNHPLQVIISAETLDLANARNRPEFIKTLGKKVGTLHLRGNDTHQLLMPTQPVLQISIYNVQHTVPHLANIGAILQHATKNLHTIVYQQIDQAIPKYVADILNDKKLNPRVQTME